MFMRGQTLEQLLVESAAAARPPVRMTVSQAAEKFRKLNNPGSYVGPLLNDRTPYLVEPMDTLQSLQHRGMIFVGPAQSAKTEMFLNWVAYGVKCDPADMMLVHMTQAAARDFSMRRIDRMHRHSPDVGEMLVGGKAGSNTYDKHYKSGMMLTLSHPSVTELSGKPVPRVFLTDYDRMPDDVDGEGNPFDLAQKRTTSFGRYGMTAAESSPGFEVQNPKWQRTSTHEAPPTKGILALFNKGDRRLWFWECVACHGKFEPAFKLLSWPDTQDVAEAAEMTTLKCPHCGIDYHHDPMNGMPGKHEMNSHGRWIRDGQIWLPSGEVIGTAIRSETASFWLKGVAAAFLPEGWGGLVSKFILAEREYQNNGSESSLKTTVNVDQGEPYLPKSVANDRVPETIKELIAPFPSGWVPEWVRFLVATVDVQSNRFEVQVHGISLNWDVTVVDRFSIQKAKRLDEDNEHLRVSPGAHPEDWKLLMEQVLLKSYPLLDGSGRRMAVKLTLCDSGGKEGVTSAAYEFVRWLRTGKSPEQAGGDEGTYDWRPGMAGRFMLLKGASTKDAPRIQVSYPDSQRKDRNAGARGEIPVLLLNVNTLKDMVDKRLDRKTAGGRFIFPEDLDDNFYIELTVEVKDPAKGWINPRGFRNESWDLLTYCLAATLTPTINIEHMDHENPPSWAAEWDANDLIYSPEQKARPFEAEQNVGMSLAELAASLA